MTQQTRVFVDGWTAVFIVHGDIEKAQDFIRKTCRSSVAGRRVVFITETVTEMVMPQLEPTRITVDTTLPAVASVFEIDQAVLKSNEGRATIARTMAAGLLYDARYPVRAIANALQATENEICLLVERYLELRDGHSVACQKFQQHISKVKDILYSIS